MVHYRLGRLVAIVDDRLPFQDTLREVRQMRQWVLDAEHILSADWVGEGVVVTNAMVAQRFDAWREGLTRQLMQDDVSSLQQQCLEQFLQVLSNQRCHLIQCYDHTDFPRTNHEMERRIRRLKIRYRRITGRKNWNSYLTRVWKMRGLLRLVGARCTASTAISAAGGSSRPSGVEKAAPDKQSRQKLPIEAISLSVQASGLSGFP